MAKIHTTHCPPECPGGNSPDTSQCVLDDSQLEIKSVPHDHGVNEEFFLNGELVKRNCNIDLNLAKKVG